MPAKPNVYVVLQCQQITFKGEGPNIFKKDLYYYYYHCNYYYSIIIIIAVATDNNDEISKNPWGCAKNVFKSGTSVSIFQRHLGYFKDALKRIDRMKVFTIPSWMPKLKEPNIPFNLSPPS